MNLDFYKGKKVFITGHTGFKGTWLSRMLVNMDAKVMGYSLNPPTSPSLFELTDLPKSMDSIIADICDYESLRRAVCKFEPDIVLHLAAQPIVREGYKNPRYTYEVNLMGTVNILEAIRTVSSVKSIVNVTTDKVYYNNEWEWGYRENELLNGRDPYSNSKSCSELMTNCYRESFFLDKGVAVSTVRAGNVIGGGDFANDRIIPDCIRAVKAGKVIEVRNPYSIRPYQHVLDPLNAYLMVAQKQYEQIEYAGSYNVGPDESDCITTGELANLFCRMWGDGATWENKADINAPHEANFLKLDCSKIKHTFGWNPKLHIEEGMDRTCELYKAWASGQNVVKVMDRQINDFLEI